VPALVELPQNTLPRFGQRADQHGVLGLTLGQCSFKIGARIGCGGHGFTPFQKFRCLVN
jgi:hypothetical protein